MQSTPSASECSKEGKGFIVYHHLRKDGRPFYVGKGVAGRHISHLGRSRLWRIFAVEEYGDSFPTVRVIAENLGEEEALELETQEIVKYGRMGIDANGILVNSVLVGRMGFYGTKHSDDTRQKISDALTGENHPLFGKKRSPATNRNISDGVKRSMTMDSIAKRAKAQTGLRCWNDGKTCVRAASCPGEGWYLGMLPRKHKLVISDTSSLSQQA